MPQLPCHDFSRGRRDTLIAVPLFCSFGRRNPSIAAPQLFFWPAQSIDCCAAVFSFGRRNTLIAAPRFFFGQHNPSIAVPEFFQLAGAIPQSPFDCCFLVLRPFAAIWRNTQASHQPFGMTFSHSNTFALWRPTCLTAPQCLLGAQICLSGAPSAFMATHLP